MSIDALIELEDAGRMDGAEALEVEIIPEGSELEGMLEIAELDEEEEVEFDANLAEYCDEACLQEISSELISLCKADKSSRKEWEDTYIKGLDQLGLKIEDRTTPWPGSCGVAHPVLTESVVRFQAQTITEIFRVRFHWKSREFQSIRWVGADGRRVLWNNSLR